MALLVLPALLVVVVAVVVVRREHAAASGRPPVGDEVPEVDLAFLRASGPQEAPRALAGTTGSLGGRLADALAVERAEAERAQIPAAQLPGAGDPVPARSRVVVGRRRRQPLVASR